MIDAELLVAVRRFAVSLGTVREIGRDLGDPFLSGVTHAFGIDPAATWWWRTVKGPVSHIRYGNADALEIVRLLVGNEAAMVRLAVTDDEPAPWPLFEGDLASILKLLGEQRVFEYFLADEKPTWVVFDNHHNELIVVGALKTKADELLSTLG